MRQVPKDGVTMGGATHHFSHLINTSAIQIPLIEAKNISFAYQMSKTEQISVLENLSLTISPSEYLAIIGHNGSGKSTLAKHFNGLLTPATGDLFVKELNTKNKENLLDIRKTVGMVFQNPDNQIIATIVEDEVAFGLRNIGVPEDQFEERIITSLKAVELLPQRFLQPHHLSAGQKQRLAIASILAMKPKCIVLDEATSMLDSHGRDHILQTIKELHQQGIAIINVTHYMEEAAEADRIVVLQKGKIVMAGTPREIFSQREKLVSLHLDVPHASQVAAFVHEKYKAFTKALLTKEEVINEVEKIVSSAVIASVAKQSSNELDCFVAIAPRNDEQKGNNLSQQNHFIEVSDLSYTYMQATPFEYQALNGVNMHINKGECIAIIGHTGSGKSTLMQHLNGLLLPQSGKVIIQGNDISQSNFDLKKLRQQIGLCLQNPEDQFFERLVGDEIAYGPFKMGLPLIEVAMRVKWAMEMVDLPFDEMKDRALFALSGGQKRKVALAGILAMQPKALILDEPTASLDPMARKELLDRIHYLNKKEKLTIIFVSHNMDEVAYLADRVYLMAKGKIVGEGTPKQIFEQKHLLEENNIQRPDTVEILYALREQGYPVELGVFSVEDTAKEILSLLQK